MYAVIVRHKRYGQWQPKLIKIARDCPKTFFVGAGRYSQTRYRKAELHYRLFDDEQEAADFYNEMRKRCRVDEMVEADLKAWALRQAAHELIMDEVATWPKPEAE